MSKPESVEQLAEQIVSQYVGGAYLSGCVRDCREKIEAWLRSHNIAPAAEKFDHGSLIADHRELQSKLAASEAKLRKYEGMISEGARAVADVCEHLEIDFVGANKFYKVLREIGKQPLTHGGSGVASDA